MEQNNDVNNLDNKTILQNMASTWSRMVTLTILTAKLPSKQCIEQNDYMKNLDNKTVLQTWHQHGAEW